MKRIAFLFMIILAAARPLAAQIAWHTMDELTRDIYTEEKLIYVLVCSSYDYFGKMFEEKILSDGDVADVLKRYYYCVRFFASEDDRVYTFFGNSYRRNGSRHELLEALSVSSTVVPSHIFLDQRPSTGEKALNALYVSQGYMQKEDFLTRIRQYPAELDLAGYAENDKTLDQVRRIADDGDFCRTIAEIAQTTSENFLSIRGSAIGGGGLGAGGGNAWESTVLFSGLEKSGTIRRSEFDGSYYASYVLAEEPGNAGCKESYRYVRDILLACFPADQGLDIRWEIDDEARSAQLIHVYEGFVYHIELTAGNDPDKNISRLELTFWGNPEK